MNEFMEKIIERGEAASHLEHNCYLCMFALPRGLDAMECTHPQLDAAMAVSGALLRNIELSERSGSTMEIKIDPTGYTLGKAYWPCVFDPIYINNCTGYMPRR
jgi:hypothetical protein